jgi:hypothetical protein
VIEATAEDSLGKDVRMLAAERRYERAADQLVRCEQLLTAELLMNKDGLH